MKAKKPLLLTVLVLVLLALVLIVPGAASADVAHTSDHHTASGMWGVYQVDFASQTDVGGYLLFTGTEYADWTGTFRGSSVEPFHGVFLPDGGYRLVVTANFKGSVYKENGKRLGTGKAVIEITGIGNPDGTAGGTWTVVSGSGGLKHLHGTGTWIGTETGLPYTGEVWLE
jgi:hypothetical protein